MLHEVLLGLLGQSGDLIVWRGDRLLVSPSLAFVTESERALVETLLPTGARFRHLQIFVDNHLSSIQTASSGPGADGLKCGLYVKAFARGIHEVLMRFRGTLAKSERDIFKNEGFTLTRLHIFLQEYEVLFPYLVKSVEIIREKKLHGAQILNVVHQFTLSGAPVVRECFQRILQVCNSVLYKQLSAWMMYGYLIDDHKEFFVELIDTEPKKKSVEANETNPSAQTKSHMLNPWLSSRVNGDQIPSFVTMRNAEKIHFVGKAINVVKRQDEHIRNEFLGPEMIQRFCDDMVLLQQSPVFDSRLFELTVDKIRDAVAKILREIVVEKFGIINHMKMLCDYFCLGNGLFYQTFIDDTKSLFLLPPTNQADQELAAAFRNTAMKINMDESDNILKTFSCFLAPHDQPLGKPVTIFDSWKNVSLAYRPQFPLDLVLSENSIQRYSSVFRYLFMVRRVQHELKQAWIPQIKQKSTPGRFSVEWGSIWRLRNHMSFFIDGLQFYLQVDVVDAQFSQFVKRVQECQDFELIKRFHEEYLNTVVSQCFVENKIASTLMNLFQQCLNLCAIISSENPTHQKEKVNEISQKYNLQFGILFTALSRSSALAPLALRIDYNGYFSRNNALSASQGSMNVSNRSALFNSVV